MFSAGAVEGRCVFLVDVVWKDLSSRHARKLVFWKKKNRLSDVYEAQRFIQTVAKLHRFKQKVAYTVR